MPKKEVKKRGGAIKTRTIKVSKNEYMKCDVVPKAGPRGGHTVCGPVKKKKKPKKRKRS